jgi:hypothetical protein
VLVVVLVVVVLHPSGLRHCGSGVQKGGQPSEIILGPVSVVEEVFIKDLSKTPPINETLCAS